MLYEFNYSFHLRGHILTDRYRTEVSPPIKETAVTAVLQRGSKSRIMGILTFNYRELHEVLPFRRTPDILG